MKPQASSPDQDSPSGILLVNKPKDKTSFALVAALRRILKVRKIGHAGTLDPFATGVMVMLVGKEFTRLSDQFLCVDKEYLATVHFGIETDSYDCTGVVTKRSPTIPELSELCEVLQSFQGTVDQVPPMFSAKKMQGKKLYELARKGINIAREPVRVNMNVKLIDYHYPTARIHVLCSKGTYIRSIAHDLGALLGCGAHLSSLHRIRSGYFNIENCIDGSFLDDPCCTSEMITRSLIKNLPAS